MLALLLSALASPQRDVVIIIADDVADEDIELTATPNIDALAAQGTRFTRAYSMPLCSGTRSSMFFGSYWTDHYRSACLPSTPTHDSGLLSIAEVASSIGFTTGVFGKWHLGRAPGGWQNAPALHGFDTARALGASTVTACAGFSYFGWLRTDDGSQPSVESQYATDAVTDAAIAWLAKPHEKPRFAWIAYHSAHEPFHNPPGGTGSGFFAMVRDLDAAVGEIMSSIDMVNTVVVFVGDNGTPSSVAPNAKLTTFERGIRVPMIVTGPGVAGGVETDSLVHVLDIYATFGGPTSGDSVDLRPVFANLETEVRSSLFVGSNHPIGGEDYAIVETRWKLRSNGEIYDLESDPEELAPITGPHPERARLEALLEEALP